MTPEEYQLTVNALTHRERQVYDSIVKQAQDGEYCACEQEIIYQTGFDRHTVKGLLGSLTKRGLIWSDKEERGNKWWTDIFAFDLVDNRLGHWCFGEFTLI